MKHLSRILVVIIDVYLAGCIIFNTVIIVAIFLLGARFNITISFPALHRLLHLFD